MILWLVGLVLAGVVVMAASIHGAHHPTIRPGEQRVFHAVNGLPDWLYWPLWAPMQLGNLVVGTLAGLAVAWWLHDVRLAIGVVVAMAAKLLAERVLRHRLTTGFEVRQRPGTSEVGAKLRGADVPASGPSFPSGHVILVAAITAVISPSMPGAWVWLPWVLSALVMFGRVYVGAHNPLDVTAGLGTGVAVGAALALAFH